MGNKERFSTANSTYRVCLLVHPRKSGCIRYANSLPRTGSWDDPRRCKPGFMAVGTPERIFDEIVRQSKRNLTVIANDTASPGRGIGKLIAAKLVQKAIVSHIGLNPETQRQMTAGELEVELVPQGTLIERIRAGGYGLGGVLTSTGIGTPVEVGK